nr:MAG TPA: hypothetical protein [Caudoviricetes sp.]
MFYMEYFTIWLLISIVRTYVFHFVELSKILKSR